MTLGKNKDEKQTLSKAIEADKENDRQEDHAIQDEQRARQVQDKAAKDQLALSQKIIAQLAATIEANAKSMRQANESMRKLLEADWNVSALSSEAQNLLFNVPAHPVEHENQIRAMEASLQTRNFNADEVGLILRSPVSDTLKQYDTYQEQANVRARVTENYSRLAKQLREALFATKLTYSPALPHKEVEEVCDRHARSFAFVAAMHGADTIHASVPHLSLRTDRSLLDVFMDAMQKTHIPHLDASYQRHQQLFNNPIIKQGFHSNESEAIKRIVSTVIPQDSHMNRQQNRVTNMRG